jgi:hypothetical protein
MTSSTGPPRGTPISVSPLNTIKCYEKLDSLRGGETHRQPVRVQEKYNLQANDVHVGRKGLSVRQHWQAP